jgi:hypothetical protein
MTDEDKIRIALENSYDKGTILIIDMIQRSDDLEELKDLTKSLKDKLESK